MNKRIIISVFVGLIIIAMAIFNLWIDEDLDANHGIMGGNRTCEDCHGKYAEKVSLAPKDFNWSQIDINKAYGIYFNNPTCKNGTGIIIEGYNYEKIDNITQMTYKLICLNETVTLIPQ